MRPLVVAWLEPLLGRSLAEVVVPGWFAMTALAALVTIYWIRAHARREGLDVRVALLATAAGYAAAVVGGIIVPLLYDVIAALASGGVVRLRWAGMVSWCGYLAGIVAVILVLRRRTLSPLVLADIAAPALGLSLVCARLGCFLAGCDYGQVSSAPWALRFPQGSPAWTAHVREGWLPSWRAESLAVHPSQLYEALLGLAMFAVCVALARTEWAARGRGRVFAAAVSIYGVGRIAIESVRGDAGRGFVGALSSAQIFCAAVLVLVAVLALRQWRPKRLVLAALVAVVALLPSTRAAAEETEGSVGASGFIAAAAPLNRRGGQVPPLAGVALSGSALLAPGFRIGGDLDSLANDVATHGSLLAIATYERQLSASISIAGRGGLGLTWVNFLDASFTDQVVPGFRAGAALNVWLTESIAITTRPIELDLISGNNIGGPIFSWQVRIGLTYRHGRGNKPSAPAEAIAPEPPPTPQPLPPAPSPRRPGQPLPPRQPGQPLN